MNVLKRDEMTVSLRFNRIRQRVEQQQYMLFRCRCIFDRFFSSSSKRMERKGKEEEKMNNKTVAHSIHNTSMEYKL